MKLISKYFTYRKYDKVDEIDFKKMDATLKSFKLAFYFGFWKQQLKTRFYLNSCRKTQNQLRIFLRLVLYFIQIDNRNILHLHYSCLARL